MRVFNKTLALPGGFTRFFLLTYTDRALSFLLPLVVLSFFGQTPYNVVELVFSYASLLYIVLDAGFSSYLFFGYRNAPAKEEFVLSAKKNFRLLLFCYCFLFIVTGFVK